VKLLRAESYREAISAFQAAIGEDQNDHRAAFGAGVACEATGQYESALKYYKQACAGEDNRAYADARDRMKSYGTRIRK
jgi:tetratricopeptide (TPR) repeat protein